MAEIKPRIAEGEPVCQQSCSFYNSDTCWHVWINMPCIPGLRQQRDEWREALQSLTPGGSEFAGDPKACAEFVKTAMHTQREVIKLFKKELDTVKKDNRELDMVKRAQDHFIKEFLRRYDMCYSIQISPKWGEASQEISNSEEGMKEKTNE